MQSVGRELGVCPIRRRQMDKRGCPGVTDVRECEARRPKDGGRLWLTERAKREAAARAAHRVLSEPWAGDLPQLRFNP